MKALAIDLGGTKLAVAVFSHDGHIVERAVYPLELRSGAAVGVMITAAVQQMQPHGFDAIGVAVPGISRRQTGTVWAPNIPGWDDYPLLAELRAVAGDIPIHIEGDRSCYIMGEAWQGRAQGCTNAIYLAVGTGIGAGILADGRLLHGAADISGAIGWMALQRPFHHEYVSCGCFESMASGEGIAKAARALIAKDDGYKGMLQHGHLQAKDVFAAYATNDRVAVAVIHQSIELWGMAAANLVSLFNPEKIIFGGGVFGPAAQFIPAITAEAARWAQPVSMGQVKIEAAALQSDAGLYGAAYLAFHA
ncbi:ROK family protein [Chitinophaga lutea]|uniref:ROK family protein n=1 Tax=Chitinophaga lutea TaxID=2488634 RepID=A0A3N4PM32_9BACT|nr:ROK family protein [Chitinophaga lutea]RPE09753.1 ROK family protein [Chitinophaga lutea]